MSVTTTSDEYVDLARFELGLAQAHVGGRAARVEPDLAEELLLYWGVAEWPAWKAYVAQHTPSWFHLPNVPHVRLPPARRTES